MYSIIKRKILLENSIDRSSNNSNWGTLTATSFYINVFLTQNIDDMGLFTNLDYIPSITATTYTTPLSPTELITLRFQNTNETNYYNYQNLFITGTTDTKKEDLMSYDEDDRYIVGFDMDVENYTNYQGVNVDGVSRIISDGEPSIYVFDAENNQDIGTNNQNTGILYKDYTGLTKTTIIDGVQTTIPLTEFRFVGEGLNQTNVSLSALTKEEYLFGIISKPEVQNDVFIERGVTSVMDMHLRMSEITNLGQLTRYGNGFYTIRRT
jgi:hypothetical protein